MHNNISFKNLFFVKNVDKKNKNIQEKYCHFKWDIAECIYLD